jgi:hypothetical protein
MQSLSAMDARILESEAVIDLEAVFTNKNGRLSRFLQATALNQRWLCSSELGSKIEVTCCAVRLGKPPP